MTSGASAPDSPRGPHALRAVGRALHQDQPAVLAALGVVNRMLLLGNV